MKKILFMSTILVCCCPVRAGLPEAMMSLDYEQYSTALEEFQALASQNNAAALYYLGTMYQNGWGVPVNIQQAINYFQAADQLFYLPAATQLGKILLYGTQNGVAAQPQKAIDLLKKAALSGSAEAALELGNATVKGLADEPNYNHAFGYYSIAALKGDKKAQYQLGQMYLVGRGIPQDYAKALSWTARSANQGYVRAQMQLADIYENNTKLKNLGKAYAWNSILAAYNSDSIGVNAAKKRDELAKKLNAKVLTERQAAVRTWTPKTPEKSVPPEERNQPLPTIPGFNDPKTLQQILLQEGALPQDASNFGLSMKTIDIAEATGDLEPVKKAIETAINKGKSKAAGFYGDLLIQRFHNPQEAIKWYETGATAGDIYAQYQLAKSYCEGSAEAPDSAKCYAWLLIANETPDPVLTTPVQQAILAVRSNATIEELERGKSLVDTLKKTGEAKKKENSILDFF